MNGASFGIYSDHPLRGVGFAYTANNHGRQMVDVADDAGWARRFR